MCLFPFPNKSSNKALIKGIEKFECGSCPECLQKKSRLWALRCAMEARVNVGVMVTLTYDSYKLDKNGKPTNEENPVDTSLSVNKKHCQDFIKRLRKHYSGKAIKYLLTAEYGKRTHRAHYHALIFGVQFDDLRPYKKSKRGNIIYKSSTLEKIWKHGICTVDCVNLSAKTARYCTKYCAKDGGVDDTFMLFSRGIGDSELIRLFNGRSYWIDGREYPIPRQIWQYYIENKYSIGGSSRYVGKVHVFDSEKRLCSKLDQAASKLAIVKQALKKINDRIDNHRKLFPTKKGFRSPSRAQWWYDRMDYLNDKLLENEMLLSKIEKSIPVLWKAEYERFLGSDKTYDRATARRENYQYLRDNDWLYKRYLAYWKRKNEISELTRPDETERIRMLPENKYRSYRAKALTAKIKQFIKRDFIPPRSRCQAFLRFPEKKFYQEKSFAPLSRHYRANDTTQNIILAYRRQVGKKILESLPKSSLEWYENPF